jgi:hypothetical protein
MQKTKCQLETTQTNFKKALGRWFGLVQNKAKFISEHYFPSTKRDWCSFKYDSIPMTSDCSTYDYDNFPKDRGAKATSATNEHILRRQGCIP